MAYVRANTNWNTLGLLGQKALSVSGHLGLGQLWLDI